VAAGLFLDWLSIVSFVIKKLPFRGVSLGFFLLDYSLKISPVGV